MQKPGLRAAINLMCKCCIYDPSARGTCLQQITDCPAVDCPLYPVRRKRVERVSGASESEGMQTLASGAAARQEAVEHHPGGADGAAR